MFFFCFKTREESYRVATNDKSGAAAAKPKKGKKSKEDLDELKKELELVSFKKMCFLINTHKYSNDWFLSDRMNIEFH